MKSQFRRVLFIAGTLMTNLPLVYGNSNSPIPDFSPTSEKKLSGELNLLSNCINTMPLFMKCIWKPEYALVVDNSLHIDAAYRSSLGTRIVINGTFVDTYRNIYLEIDGISHPILDGVASQSFPLPPGTSGTVSMRLTTPFSGEVPSKRTLTAIIHSTSIILDNSAQVNQVLNMAPILEDQLITAVSEYQRQLKFAKYLTQTKQTIGLLKEVELGRAADDLSDDCFRPTKLLPGECQTLIDFNKILRGDTSDFSEEKRLLAWQQLEHKLQDMQKVVDYLQLAHLEVYEAYLNTVNTAYTLITQSPLMTEGT